MDPVISVIVPVYGVEKYLPQCTAGVLGQSFRNLELILVDDGSPDRCPEICDKLAGKDSRVSVIHKANGGLSDARNAGLEHAVGEYVLFLDGDDYWDDPGALARLTERAAASGADILHFSYKKVFEDTGAEKRYFDVPDMPLGLRFAEQIKYLTDNGLFIASACNKMIRRTILKDVEFEKGVYSEDIVWCLDVMRKAQAVDYVCEDFYCYRQRSRSITHTVNSKRCDDLAKAISGCFCRLSSADSGLQALFRTYTAFQYGTFVLVQAQAEAYQKETIRALTKHKHILKYHAGNKKLLCLRLASLLLGYKAMCRIVRTVYRAIKK